MLIKITLSRLPCIKITTGRRIKMESCVNQMISATHVKEGNKNPSLTQNVINDILVKVNDEEFLCNKKKMMESSEFFRGMFESEMMEATSNCVRIEETDIETMSAVIDFCRNGQLDLTEYNVHQVAVIASKYQVSKLITKCSLFLKNTLNAENCFSTLFIAETFYLKEAYDKAKHYVLWHFMNLLVQEEFLEMEVCQLRRIVSDPQLNVSCELDVLNAVMCWINRSKSERLGFLAEILQEISVYCNQRDIVSIEQSLGAQNIPSELLTDFCSALSQNCHKKSRYIPHQLISVGVHIEDEMSDEHESPRHLVSYDIDNRQTTLYTNVPEGCLVSHDSLMEKKGYSVFSQGEKMYVSGGEEKLGKNTWMMSVWCFSALENSWSCVGELRNPRRHHAMCVSGEERVLLMGGFGRFRYRLDSVEELNTKTGEWCEKSPMPEKMVNINACQCNNKVFVIKNGTISSILSYNIKTDQWTWLSLQNTIGDVAYDAKRIWMIPYNSCLFLGLDIVPTVLKFNTVTHEVEESSVFSSEEDRKTSHYDLMELIPKYLNENCDLIQVLKNIYNIDADIEKEKLCNFFQYFLKNEIVLLPSFPGLM